MSDLWRIEPMVRLGRLPFELTTAELAPLTALYGAPGPLRSHGHVADDLEKVIAELGLAAEMSAEDLAAIREAAAETAGLVSQTVRGAGPTLLEYVDDRLACVMVEPACGPVSFRDQHVFELSAGEALKLFETANGAPGRYRATEAAFDNLAISLSSFSLLGADGSLRILTDADEAFFERSLSLRRVPYRPENEIGQFVTRSVL